MNDLTKLTPSEREALDAALTILDASSRRDYVYAAVESIVCERLAQSGQSGSLAALASIDIYPPESPDEEWCVGLGDAPEPAGDTATEALRAFVEHVDATATPLPLSARPAVSIEAIRDVLDEHKAWIPDVGRRDHLARVIAARLSSQNAERTNGNE